MRSSSTLHSPPQTESLHPVIRGALSSLDVQLEEELTRYRRLRALGKSGYTSRQTTAKGTVRAQQPPAIAPVADRTPAPASSPTVEAGITARTGDEQAPPTSPPGSQSYSDLHELAKQYAAQIHQEAELAAGNDGPNDYLESSEELLRSLAEEEASVQVEEGFLKSLSTPLGIGSMLLLLISSAMFGFVIMNPSSMTQWFSQQKPEVATNTGTPANPNPATSADTPATLDVPQPNLANQEFPDLNLSTLGSLSVDRASTSKSGVLPGKPSVAAGKDAQKANLGISGKATLGVQSQSRSINPAVPPVGSSAAEPVPAVEVPSPRRLAPATGYNPPPAPVYRSPAPPVQPYTPPPARSYSAPAAKPVRPRSATPKPSAAGKPAKSPQNSSSAAPEPAIPPLKLSPAPSPATPVPSAPINSPSPSPVPAASSPPAATVPNAYKVVTPYSSDRTLEKAREQVPDAYLQNYSDGAKVQLGSYDNESTAKQRAEELRQQGIPAEVYKP